MKADEIAAHASGIEEVDTNKFVAVSNGETCMDCKLDQYDVLCDNEASIDVFHNKELLTNIRPATNVMTISGIGGKLVVNKVGDFELFGITVYYHPESIGNILCYYDLVKRFDVRFDAKRNIFTVATKKGVFEFQPKGKLYVFNANPQYMLVGTVEQNKKKFTNKEIVKADKAVEFNRVLGYPSTKDTVEMLKAGGILNPPISIQDVHRSLKIYGPPLATLKGKTTRRTPDEILLEKIDTEIPKDNIVLAVDIFYIAGITFLLAISRRICFMMVRYLSDRSTKIVREELDSIFVLLSRVES